jgi:predicted outer membrane repeat protein
MSNVALQNGFAFFGGAIYVDHGSATLSHCTFSKNTAGASFGTPGTGGAIHVYGTATLSNCIFSENTAAGGNGNAYGGAILVWGTVTLSNCIFSKNTAQYAGGALYFNSDGKVNSNGLLKNCSLLGTVSSKEQ